MSQLRALLVGTVLALMALAPAAGAQGLWPILDQLAGKNGSISPIPSIRTSRIGRGSSR